LPAWETWRLWPSGAAGDPLAGGIRVNVFRQCTRLSAESPQQLLQIGARHGLEPEEPRAAVDRSRQTWLTGDEQGVTGMVREQPLEETWVYDIYEANRPGRTGVWLVAGEGLTIVDPGSERTLATVFDAVWDLGFGLRDIRRIVVTHVHLDHMGGVGRLLEEAPEAVVYCHPRAAQHLVDPSRLEASARRVYGDRFERLWGGICPCPSWRVKPLEDGGTVPAGGHRLVFFHSPGHARHHVTVLDERTGGLFSGDTIGVRYDPRFTGWGFVYGLPTTSPPDFDLEAMRTTLDRLEKVGPEAVLHAHYGMSRPASTAFQFTRHGLDGMARLLENAKRPRDATWFRDALTEWVREDLKQQGHGDLDPEPLMDDLWLNAEGLYVYWQRLHPDPASAVAETK
jgi:glyoxylase-like metal-dependent hydrolase (beta-lactamase superfamily II)